MVWLVRISNWASVLAKKPWGIARKKKTLDWCIPSWKASIHTITNDPDKNTILQIIIRIIYLKKKKTAVISCEVTIKYYKLDVNIGQLCIIGVKNNNNRDQMYKTISHICDMSSRLNVSTGHRQNDPWFLVLASAPVIVLWFLLLVTLTQPPNRFLINTAALCVL